MTVAALYVQTNGVYYGLEGVEPWDEARDARLYDGPWPVVAHPPCNSWCQLAPVNEERWGFKVGDDGGTFAAALKAVRRFGGVLEHPAYSYAWPKHDLTEPYRGAWQATFCGGWVTEVSQSAYGHSARKRTWLYAFGCLTPQLDWSDPEGIGVVGAGVNSGQSAGRPRIQGAEASRTPETFRDVLLEMARSAALVTA